MNTTTTPQTFACVATSTSDIFTRPYRPAPPPPQLKFRKVKRDFISDWEGEILCAYHSVMGDAPPQRLQRKRRALMAKLRIALKLAQSYQPGVKRTTVRG